MNRYDAVPLADFAALVETPRPPASAGAVTAVAASLAASLVVKACALTRDGSLAAQGRRAAAIAGTLGRFADDDEDAFAAYLAASGVEAKRVAAAAAATGARTFAAVCEELAELADDVASRCAAHVVGEAVVAGLLARATGAAATAIATANDPDESR